MPFTENWRNGFKFWLVVLGIGVLNVALGQIEFGGYDGSMLIDLGWRQHLGQLPYRDFRCMLPPSFYLLSRAAVAAFGAHWWAFTLINSILWLVLVAVGRISIWLCRDWLNSQQGDRLTLVYVVSLAVPFLATNHLWHSALTAEFIVFLLLLLFLQLEQVRLDNPAELRAHLVT
jgi:hypothetical protein